MEALWTLMHVRMIECAYEALRLAYVASRWAPAVLVVGGAALLAGLIGAAVVLRVKLPRTSFLPLGAWGRWFLAVALTSGVLAAPPARGDVLCRKAHSRRVVVRAEACRPTEHAMTPSDLGIPGGTCMEGILLAWRQVQELRAHLDAARDLAVRLQEVSWPGAETWLAIEHAMVEASLTDVERSAIALGAEAARDAVGDIRRLVEDVEPRSPADWADACAQALALLPPLEVALLVPAVQ